MTPYHYSVVQCRDGTYPGERRNVGLLVVSPTLRKAWLRRANLSQRAHLLGDAMAFVAALLDALDEEATQVAREGSAAVVHGWLKARARPSEDVLVLSDPAVGICDDVTAEVGRLREHYLGRVGGGGKSRVEKLRDEVLRAHGLRAAFAPREFESGPATWGFPCVADSARRPLVFNALTFDQREPEGVLDAAFRNVGRAGEVVAFHPGVRWLTVAAGPAEGFLGRAFTRACELMDGAGLNLVAPDPARVAAELARLGLASSGSDRAEA